MQKQFRYEGDIIELDFGPTLNILEGRIFRCVWINTVRNIKY